MLHMAKFSVCLGSCTLAQAARMGLAATWS